MSECPDDNLLVAYAAGSLKPQEREVLERHLEGCDVCRTLVAEAAQDDVPIPSLGEGPGGEAPVTLGPGAILGRYVVLAPLGAGGMGTVFSAYDPKLERRVALKLLHAEARTSEDARAAQGRLLKEAQVMARLAHPNVVAVFDVGTWQDRVFLAMEFVDGGTLRKWLAAPGRTQKEIVEALIQAGRGLEAAHAAGLVHRDFKPDNVLVSGDGRVLVTDFGLAHASSEPAHAVTAPAMDLELMGGGTLASTQTGALIGTPAYMAPEQLVRRKADARSDQFAFCVTAWEALTGQRPFELEELSQMAASIVSLQLEAPRSSGITSSRDRRTGGPRLPPDVKLPAYLHRALRKGLRLNPEHRHDDLSALLRALSSNPAARRRTRWTLSGLSLALVSGAVLWGWQWSEARALRCTGGLVRVEAIWNGQREGKMRERFNAVDPVRGLAISERLSGFLDAWGVSWSEQYRAACEATRIRAVQSEEMLTLRYACLERRLQEADALIGEFILADKSVLHRAPDALQSLPPLETCADVVALSAPVPMPEDGEARATAEALEEELATVRAHLLTGRFADGVGRAKEVLGQARALGYPPLTAEAGTLLGHYYAQRGERAAAAEVLKSAILDADRGRDDQVRMDAALTLSASQLDWNQIDAAEDQWRTAEAAMERLGTPTPRRGILQMRRGEIDAALGKTEVALKSYLAAAETFERHNGKGALRRGNALGNAASCLFSMGRFEEAEAVSREAVAILEKHLGDSHPSLIGAMTLRAYLFSERGNHSQAIATIDRTVEMVSEHFPKKHSRWPWVLDAKATVEQAAGHYRAAIQKYRHSMELKRDIFPEGDPDFFFSHDGIGQCLLELGRFDEAIEELERALEIELSDPGAVGQARFALARALTEAGREPQRVPALLAQAAEDFEQAHRDDLRQKLAAWREANLKPVPIVSGR